MTTPQVLGLPGSERHVAIRWLVAGVSVVVWLATLVYMFAVARDAGGTGFGKLPFNDVVKGAVQLRLDTSRSLFQVTLLIFGALWGLIVTREGLRHKVSDSKPEFILFAVANLCLLLSSYAYLRYSMRI